MKLADNRITGKSAISFVGKNILYFAIAILVIVTEIQKPEFLLALPLNLLNRTAAYVIMALGVGSIMMIGVGTDLSAGRIMGLVSLVAASLLQNAYAIIRAWPNLPAPKPSRILFVVLLVLVIGAAIGIFNGFFVGKFKLPAFIVTLSTQLMVYGTILVFLGFTYTPGAMPNLMEQYKNFITGFAVTDWLNLPFSIPNYVWYAIILVVLMWIVWEHTPLGKKMRIIGSNREAAKTMNVNVFATTVIVFAMAGALYGINGFVEAARVGGPGASAGANAEIDAIIACLLGGMSLMGGTGRIGGIVVGVILIQLISVCLQWLSVSANLVYIIKGGILILAVTMDAVKNKS